MKKIVVAAIVGVASINANATVFAPWTAPAPVKDEVAQERTTTPAAGPFYRSDASRVDSPDAEQVRIDIKPWYLTGGA